ncbi:MAG: A/G-specific adenine glycosylase [Verrucomicrobia bacterium]|nr:A/G-specific adenine glycosylase [Verrucomicrobiota bacterium]MBS0637711.1 A/G-specific adenine glycosylase [Verrucomicrobiota bacterium]
MKKLATWFIQNRRDFPWRHNPTPYHVWISEVMLQQTQGPRVVDFYNRWMKRLPTLKSVAEAPLEDLLKLWEGLGYYSRVRSIHHAAKDIVERFNGALPNNAADLSSIKGLGPYTVGAILAFGFHQKQPAVDANVARVLARYFALSDDISKATTLKKFRELTLSVLPDNDPHIVAEALIELGAVICKKRPECTRCPLKQDCKAFKEGLQESLPVKSLKIAYETLYRDVAVVMHDEHLLVRQGKKGIACSGLYEFPYFDGPVAGRAGDELGSLLQNELQLDANFEYCLDDEKQSFTKYRVTLYPKFFRSQSKTAILDHVWVHKHDIGALTFSSGHKRLLDNILEES